MRPNRSNASFDNLVHRSWLGGSGATAATLLLWGCVASGDPAASFGADRLLCTSNAALAAEADVPEEWYSLGDINDDLTRDAELRAYVGLSRVTSCDEARLYSMRRLEFTEQQPSFDASAVADESVKISKILGGTIASMRSVVALGDRDGRFCTGTLINSDALLTAAHCIPESWLFLDTDGDGIPDQGQGLVNVTYRNAGDNLNYCLTRSSQGGGALGACGTALADQIAMSVAIHPSYTGNEGTCGSVDTSDDIALLVSSRAWNSPATSSAHWSGLHESGLRTGHDFRAIGAGCSADQGTKKELCGGGWRWSGSSCTELRYDADLANIDWIGSSHLYSLGGDSDGVRLCPGDSGGPALTSTATRIIIGVASNVELSGSGTMANPYSACTKVNGKQRYTLTHPKLDWIESVLWDWNGVTCTQAEQAESPYYVYRRCW